MNFWKLKASGAGAQKALDIEVFGVIEPGFWDDGGVTSAAIAKQLHDHADAKSLTVHINSDGGDVFGGIAIYNLLRQHPAAQAGKLESVVEGIAASAASLIAMAGKTRMRRGAMIMIHNPWTLAMGDAADMRKTADTLDTVRESLVSIYQSKTGKTADEIKAMLDQETWLTADDAKRQGFADEIEATPLKAAARAGLVILNAIAFARARMPQPIVALADATPLDPPPPPAVVPPKGDEEMKVNAEVRAELGLPEEADEIHVEDRVLALAKFEREVLAAFDTESIEDVREKLKASAAALVELPQLRALLTEVQNESQRRDLRATLEGGLGTRKLNLGSIQREIPLYVADRKKRAAMRDAFAALDKTTRASVLDAACSIDIDPADLETIKEHIANAPVTSPDPIKEPSRERAEIANQTRLLAARMAAVDAELALDPLIKPSVAQARAAQKNPALFGEITQINEGA